MTIEVSGCYLVLVICGQQPRSPGKRGGHGRVTCPNLKIWAGSLPESHSWETAQTGIAGAARP
jgi:hypothetical protein